MTSQILTITIEYGPGYSDLDIDVLQKDLARQLFDKALDDGTDLSKPFFIQTGDFKSNVHFDTRKVEARLVTEVYPKWQCRALYRFPVVVKSPFPIGYSEGDVSVAYSPMTFVEERCRLLREHDEKNHQFQVEDTLVDIPDRQIGHRA